MSKPTLAYWDIRGLAESIRYMLKYLGVDFEDKRYACGDAPTFDISSWLSVKPNLGLAFPNLPYYIDDSVKITESFAIMRHIARKNGALVPTTTEEWAQVDMLEGVVGDLRRSYVGICYTSDHANKKEAFFKQLPGKLDLFNAHLGKNKWLAGNVLTYIDFAFAELLDALNTLQPGCFDKYNDVKNFFNNFFKLEKINAYRSSSEFQRFPLNNKMAAWVGSK